MGSHLVCDNAGEGCLSKPRRSEEEYMVEGLTAQFCGFDVDLQILFRFLLTDVVV